MEMNKKIILFGAGMLGKQALFFFGLKNVYCFVDNKRADMVVSGKPVISFQELTEIHDQYTVVISVGSEYVVEIAEQLFTAGIHYVRYDSIMEQYREENYNPKIRKWKNAYKGEKCLLIGNGPSLRVEDLEGMQKKGCVTFGCNLINKLYDKTDWRCDLYFAGEPSVLEVNKEFIATHPCKAKFLRELTEMPYYEGLKDTVFLCNDTYFFSIGFKEEFSQDVSIMCNSAWSIMYPMIEFAVYMGFSEIYLIGVDNTMFSTVHSDDFLHQKTHFYEEDADELAVRRKIIPSSIKYNEESLYEHRLNTHYMIARKYAEKHGIKIRNATRGGRLEVFERVDIDELLR